MYLTEEDLVIRNAVAADGPQLAEWWNDGKVMAHAGFPLGLGITAEEIAKSLACDRDDTRRRLVMEKAGVPIGEMGYRCLDDGSAEIGIKICDFGMQERGLGRRYLQMLIGELFAMGRSAIVLDTNVNNLRAQHVYESLGFTRVALRENCWTDQLGQLQSAVDYILLPENLRKVF